MFELEFSIGSKMFQLTIGGENEGGYLKVGNKVILSGWKLKVLLAVLAALLIYSLFS